MPYSKVWKDEDKISIIAFLDRDVNTSLTYLSRQTGIKKAYLVNEILKAFFEGRLVPYEQREK